MNYAESLHYLYERLPMFQRIGAAAIKKDLGNTLKMLEELGNPHKTLKSVHIAGTNGKGSSAHALSAILQEAGYKTGLYTSPHLKSFTERIRVNGVEVPEDFVASFVTNYRHLIEQINPSFFEVTVVMAFQYFHEEKVDLAIVETGLGGRLDSTNVITPEVSLITMIGWDHADLLGDTLEKIAGEKAGIIKPSVPVVIGADQPGLLPVFKRKAGYERAPLILASGYELRSKQKEFTFQSADVMKDQQVLYEDLQTDITAGYFLKNIPGILEVIFELRRQGWSISHDALLSGFRAIKLRSGLKGRWQVIERNPYVVADVSHNEPGLRELFSQVSELDYSAMHLVFGVVRDKDLGKILPLLPPEANLYFTQSQVPRSMGAEELKNNASVLGYSGEAFPDVNDAIRAAKKKALPTDLILICGSTFVVAEIADL